jgi:hypothetical protein
MASASPSDDVGADLIDAYLIAVENALVSAGAPRADRMQVLQNLETQITEMLADHALPFTEDVVRAVLDKLEPPSHFAATYRNEQEASRPAPVLRGKPPRWSWPVTAAVSCALLIVGCLLLLLGSVGHSKGLAALGGSSLFIGSVVTPFALWRAFDQLRASSQGRSNRDLVLKSTIVYGAIAPALLMALVTVATQGYVLLPLGAAVFVYLQYLLIRWVWQRMSEALPTAPVANDKSNGDAPTPPVASAISMPAM